MLSCGEDRPCLRSATVHKHETIEDLGPLYRYRVHSAATLSYAVANLSRSRSLGSGHLTERDKIGEFESHDKYRVGGARAWPFPAARV